MSVMQARTLAEVARVTGGVLHGADATFARVVIDTRKLGPGDLFVALAGERTDGHTFTATAAAQGAVGALVERRTGAALSEVVVGDVRSAFGQAARAWRAQRRIPVVGVTGSNGKTTTKQLLASILSQRGPTLATEGNLNNLLGVPLTLFRLEPAHQAAVIEMGADHVGEIAELAALARPDVGLVTNAGPSHLEGFGSLDGVARGKGEMYAGLPADGVAVINADDHYAPLWRGLAGARRVLDFGRHPAAAVGVVPGSVTPEDAGQSFLLRTPHGERRVRLGFPGAHNVMNALAASAAALAAGATLDDIATGLAAAQNVGGRLALLPGRAGCLVVDDTYNANPASMRAALEWTATLGRPVLFVMGDMGELGADADALHAEVGHAAHRAGVRQLFALGTRTRHAVAAFGSGASHHADLDALLTALGPALAHDVVVLVKGSRSARMERVVAALRLPSPATGEA